MINGNILTELGAYFKPGIHIQCKTECNVDAEIKFAAIKVRLPMQLMKCMAFYIKCKSGFTELHVVIYINLRQNIS